MALVLGTVLLAILGVFHHFALRGVGRVIPDKSTNRAPLIAFMGLALVHLVEIAGYASFYFWADGLLWPTMFGTGFDGWVDYAYFSAVNFTTLGYTDLQIERNARLVSALQSLGGFMVLTWSATYLYTVYQRTVMER